MSNNDQIQLLQEQLKQISETLGFLINQNNNNNQIVNNNQMVNNSNMIDHNSNMMVVSNNNLVVSNNESKMMVDDEKENRYSTILESKEYMGFKIKTPQEFETGKLVTLLIDVSGSMNDCQFIKNPNGTNENSGLSTLDLLKYSLKILITTLNESDYLTFATFSYETIFQHEKLKMTKKNKDMVIDYIDNINGYGSTNFWEALTILFKKFKNTNNEKIKLRKYGFVFTDGQPTDSPIARHGMKSSASEWRNCTLEIYREYIKDFVSIDVIGFGSNIESEILQQIAIVAGNANFYHIPSLQLVFCVMARVLAFAEYTYGINAYAVFRFDDNTQKKLLLGKLRYDMENTIVFRKEKNSPSIVNVEFSYVDLTTGTKVNENYTNIKYVEDTNLIDDIFRNLMIEVIENLLIRQDKHIIESFKNTVTEYFNRCRINMTPYVEALIYDLKEVELSIQQQNYSEWGQHWLRMILLCHANKTCPNFMEKSMQYYITKAIGTYINYIDSLMNIVEPPKSRSSNKTYSTQNMGQFFNNPQGGCFTGDCQVELIDGITEKVENLEIGDIVKTANGFAEIIYILKTIIDSDDNITMMENNNGLRITEYHPVLDNDGVWKFPKDIEGYYPIEVSDKYIYSIAVGTGHIIMINDTQVIGFGHDIQEPVASHPFFGSKVILDNLNKLSPKYNKNGYVTIPSSFIKRDAETGLISEISELNY
jgi:hypothetical protein